MKLNLSMNPHAEFQKPITDDEYSPTYIIVHHSAVDSPDPQFKDIDAWHRVRKFPKSKRGFHVGYHKVIEKDGTVEIARDDLERDCDALGHNFDSLSVCLVGNLSKNDPTDAQVLALGEVLTDWVNEYKIHPTKIFPHRHFASTQCYGNRLENNWATIVMLSHKHLKGSWKKLI